MAEIQKKHPYIGTLPTGYQEIFVYIPNADQFYGLQKEPEIIFLQKILTLGI